MKIKNVVPSAEEKNYLAATYHAAAAAKGFHGDDAVNFDKNPDGFKVRQSLLILSEALEMYDAIRANKITHPPLNIGSGDFIELYKQHCKGTAAEELADVVIRLYDCAGAAHLVFTQDVWLPRRAVGVNIEPLDDLLFDLCEIIALIAGATPMAEVISLCIKIAYEIADYLQVDIQEAITQKAAYNKSREYKHGKVF
jgi:NTP pyrophosphatase (non-canonical NTP hydrolase)